MESVNNQYLSKEILVQNIGILELSTNDLISGDTYNETKILETYNSFKKEDKILIYKAAIQLAIIGYGQKNYGAIRVDNEHVIPLIDLFNKHKIKYNEKLSAKYEEGELSVRRLLRFFRYQVMEFIINTRRPSYLWLKYSTKDIKFMTICFPGAEHMVETKEEANYLIQTYANLDDTMKTGFVVRLKRVFIARKIFTPLELEQKK